MPILLIGATRDVLCPMEFIQQAKVIANQSGNQQVEVLEVDTSHFHIYHETAVKDKMVSFLKSVVPST